MNYRFLSVTLFTLVLPHLIAASQCPTCDSFSAALKSCQTPGLNITDVGSKMNTETVHCMCVSSSSTTKTDDCLSCAGSANEVTDVGSTDQVTVDVVALLAWYDVCYADDRWGDQQAVACWEGLLDGSASCYEKTSGKGSDITSPDPVASSASRYVMKEIQSSALPF